ncbi:ATP-dependent metalloprotease [Allorhodopirellula solitaria]|uniref:ATP-dependent metalloprotease n=2 Tax=Allorhodopirellula solitaria TaxID=2527987 RepID=A0A5C5YDU3_9BACT|nr:ATP-dependent metalloprotease [Allorhodopirellula solitaria]
MGIRRRFGYTKIMNTPDSNSSPAKPDEGDTPSRTATAYHEAGHAVMAVSLGRQIHKVTIAPGKQAFGGTRLGHCEIKKGRTKGANDQLEDDVLILLAGMVAEARFTGQYCHRGADRDLKDVANLLCTRAASSRQHVTLRRRMLAKTEHILSDDAHVAAMTIIADELLEKTTISGRAVRHHFHQAQQQHS